MSRETILDCLVEELNDLQAVSKATMRRMLFVDQEKNLPYIGVIPGDEITLVDDGYDTRSKLDVTLLIKTVEDQVSIETLIADVKALIRSVDLGSEVNKFELVGIQEVELSDNAADKYSAVGILTELVYTENHGIVYPTIESRSLTEPTGYAHYKIYETLVSGSTTIQSLGTNVYDNHFKANINIPAASGSLSIGSLIKEFDEDDQALFDDERVENNIMGFEVRCHSAFIGEFGIIPQPFADRSIMDNVTSLLWGQLSSDLGNNYRVHEITDILYNQTFERTTGAVMVLQIEKVITYT